MSFAFVIVSSCIKRFRFKEHTLTCKHTWEPYLFPSHSYVIVYLIRVHVHSFASLVVFECGGRERWPCEPQASVLNCGNSCNILQGFIAYLNASRYCACLSVYRLQEKIFYSHKKMLFVHIHCSLTRRSVERQPELQMHVAEDL